MGCTASTESAAVVNTTAKDLPAHHHEKREKKITAGTETMAISTHHDDSKIDTTATATTTDNTPSPPANTTTKTDINETTKSTNASSSAAGVVVGNLTVRYACLSKRGRDPDDASKPNQDCYGVHHHETICCYGRNDEDNKNNSNFADTAFFAGVYDGHGPHGQACAQFVQERLPDLVKKNMLSIKKQQQHQINDDNKNLSSSIDQVQASLHRAHTECNDELRLSQINDAYSGTTSISLYIHDQSRITVCNVGDSRAILGTTKSKSKTKSGDSASSSSSSLSLQAVPLSNDQTPHRSDEASRCVRSGARILSFGQIDPSSKADDDDDSEVEDPPRVWSQKGKYPGTAFTRSLGDAVAEQLGVFAEPEMLTLKISQNEKLMVLASDGVFDVLSNQEVIDLCQHKDNPTQACHAVLKKSHQEWLLNEECVDEDSASYDDMTVVCIFIDDVRDESRIGTASAAAAATTASNDDVQLAPPSTTMQQNEQQQQHHPKRVRQKTLRNLEEMEEDR